MWEMLSALGVVIGMIVMLRFVLMGISTSKRTSDRLRVVETCGLGPRQRLHVVQVEGERILVASGDGGVTLIRPLPTVPQVPEGEEEAAPQERWRTWARGFGMSLVVCAAALVADPASAEDPIAGTVASVGSALDLGAATAPDKLANTLEIVLLMTLISVAPSILLMGTCFTRVVIVLSLLRQAIGIQQLPPNQVLVGLALFVTMSVMAPVGQRIHDEALAPYIAEEIDAGTALDQGLVPARQFLMAHTREKDVELFLSFSTSQVPETLEQIPMSVLLPSYMMSELRTAFEIGFMVFLPFLVIDLVVASVLISMGMIVLPPIVISLPFKIMLFVLLDGWNLVVGSLLRGLTGAPA